MKIVLASPARYKEGGAILSDLLVRNLAWLNVAPGQCACLGLATPPSNFYASLNGLESCLICISEVHTKSHTKTWQEADMA